MKTNIFDLDRIGLLFRRYFTERLHTELIYWSIMIIAFMFIRNAVPAVFMLICIASSFYSARFFREIHSGSNGTAYFMIPATQAEKLTVSILMTSVYYLAMMMITYITGNILGTLLNNMLASMNGFINIFQHSQLQWVLFTDSSTNTDNNGLLTMIAVYLINQSIFLLGGIYFKNNHAFKTLFTVFVIQILFSIFLFTEIRLIFGESNINYMNFNDPHAFGEMVGKILRPLVYLLPPFFWIVSYFRLTEKQV